MREINKKYAVIWKRDKKILALYGMKKTRILHDEWQSTTGDNDIFTSYMIFDKKSDAERWRGNNADWEVVPIKISF